MPSQPDPFAAVGNILNAIKGVIQPIIDGILQPLLKSITDLVGGVVSEITEQFVLPDPPAPPAMPSLGMPSPPTLPGLSMPAMPSGAIPGLPSLSAGDLQGLQATAMAAAAGTVGMGLASSDINLAAPAPDIGALASSLPSLGQLGGAASGAVAGVAAGALSGAAGTAGSPAALATVVGDALKNIGAADLSGATGQTLPGVDLGSLASALGSKLQELQPPELAGVLGDGVGRVSVEKLQSVLSKAASALGPAELKPLLGAAGAGGDGGSGEDALKGIDFGQLARTLGSKLEEQGLADAVELESALESAAQAVDAAVGGATSAVQETVLDALGGVAERASDVLAGTGGAKLAETLPQALEDLGAAGEAALRGVGSGGAEAARDALGGGGFGAVLKGGDLGNWTTALDGAAEVLREGVHGALEGIARGAVQALEDVKEGGSEVLHEATAALEEAVDKLAAQGEVIGHEELHKAAKAVAAAIDRSLSQAGDGLGRANSGRGGSTVPAGVAHTLREAASLAVHGLEAIGGKLVDRAAMEALERVRAAAAAALRLVGRKATRGLSGRDLKMTSSFVEREARQLEASVGVRDRKATLEAIQAILEALRRLVAPRTEAQRGEENAARSMLGDQAAKIAQGATVATTEGHPVLPHGAGASSTELGVGPAESDGSVTMEAIHQADEARVSGQLVEAFGGKAALESAVASAGLPHVDGSERETGELAKLKEEVQAALSEHSKRVKELLHPPQSGDDLAKRVHREAAQLPTAPTSFLQLGARTAARGKPLGGAPSQINEKIMRDMEGSVPAGVSSAMARRAWG